MGRTVFYRTHHALTRKEVGLVYNILELSRKDDWWKENFKLSPARGTKIMHLANLRAGWGLWGFTKTDDEGVWQVFKYLRMIEQAVPLITWDVHDEGDIEYKGLSKVEKFAGGCYDKNKMGQTGKNAFNDGCEKEVLDQTGS